MPSSFFLYIKTDYFKYASGLIGSNFSCWDRVISLVSSVMLFASACISCASELAVALLTSS